MRKLFLLFTIAVLAFSSCKKGIPDAEDIKNREPSYLKIINALPYPSLEVDIYSAFYRDTTQIVDSLIFLESFPHQGFVNLFSTPVPNSTANGEFTVRATYQNQTANLINYYLLTLKDNAYSSLWLVDSAGINVFYKMDELVPDTLVDSTKSEIRFVNANFNKTDLSLISDSVYTSTSVNFMGASNYTKINPGDYNFGLSDGSTTLKYRLLPMKKYTFYHTGSSLAVAEM